MLSTFWPIGKFYGYLVYIFFRLGMLYQEKSGNPDSDLLMLPPLVFVGGMEDGLLADVADVTVDAGAVLVVAALAHHVEGAKLRLGVGDRHLGHGVRVDDERPALVVLKQGSQGSMVCF
jgi:hypothetical protein